MGLVWGNKTVTGTTKKRRELQPSFKQRKKEENGAERRPIPHSEIPHQIAV